MSLDLAAIRRRADAAPWRELLTWAAFAGVGAFLLFRAMAAAKIPTWGWDERTYTEEALRFATDRTGLTLREALYPYLMHWVFVFKDGYFAVAKVINIVLQGLAFVIFYACARRVLPRLQAALATLLAASLGQHLIASHIMTENLILPLYWLVLLAWTGVPRRMAASAVENRGAVAAARAGLQTPAYWMAGAATGLASLVTPKFTPFFIALALVGPVVVVRLGGRGLLRARPALALAAAVVTVVLGYLLARYAALWLMYGGFSQPEGIYAGSERYNLDILLEELRTKPRAILDMLAVHLASWGFYFLLFAGLSVVALVDAWRRKDGDALFLFAAGALGLLGVAAQAVLFVILEGHYSPLTGSAIYRYFYFAVPIVFIAGFYLARPLRWWERGLVASLLAAAGAISLYVFFYQDNPRINLFSWLDNADHWVRTSYPSLQEARRMLSYAVFGLAAVVFFIPVRLFLAAATAVAVYYSALTNYYLADQLHAFLDVPETDCTAIRDIEVDPRARVAFIGLNRVPSERTAMAYPLLEHRELLVGAFGSDADTPLAERLIKDPRPESWRAAAVELANRYDYLLLENVPGVPIATLNVVEQTRSCVLIALR